MPARNLKALEHHFYAELNKGMSSAMAAYDEMIATNCVFHSATGEDLHGLKDFKKRASEHGGAFPDSHITINDIIVEGNKAVLRYTVTCSHKGELMGIPATNKKLTISVIEIHRFVRGKIVEAWETSDTLGMMLQLGVMPTLGKEK
jgi:steroid delta-isomerase-like uncharacterized protein